MNITEFVVGLGLDSDNFTKGMTSAIGKVGGFKSAVLQAGAAVAGAFTVKALTIDFAKQNDQLRQMAQYLGLSSDELYGLSQAAKTYGADISETYSLLRGLSQAKAAMDKGEIGIFEDLAKSGVDIGPLMQAKDAGEMVLKLASQIKNLNQNQRLNVASALGVSPQMLELLSKGRGEVETLAKMFRNIRPHTKEYEESSRKLNEQLVLLDANVGSVADKIGNVLTNRLGAVISKTNEWFNANRDVNNSGIDSFCVRLGNGLDTIGNAIERTLIGFGKLKDAWDALVSSDNWKQTAGYFDAAEKLVHSDDNDATPDTFKALLNSKDSPVEAAEPPDIRSGVKSGDQLGDEVFFEMPTVWGAAITPASGNATEVTSDRTATSEVVRGDAKSVKTEPKVNVNTNVYIGNERIKNIARTESKAVVSEVLDNALVRDSQVGDY